MPSGPEAMADGCRQKNPIGIEPRIIWLERRRDDLYAAVARYRQAVMHPEIAWLEDTVRKSKAFRDWKKQQAE